MGWELAAIWAVIVAAIGGFIWEELARRREKLRAGPQVSVAGIEAGRRAVEEAERMSRILRSHAIRPDERRRAHLRAIGF